MPSVASCEGGLFVVRLRASDGRPNRNGRRAIDMPDHFQLRQLDQQRIRLLSGDVRGQVPVGHMPSLKLRLGEPIAASARHFAFSRRAMEIE